MSLAYFDTSVVVKNYIREPGSARARALLRTYEFLSSAVAPIELRSAVQRRYRQGEMTKRHYTAILTRLNQDRQFWRLVEPVPQVLSKAEELVADLSLRTLDAVHLASALIIQEALRTPLSFVSADERQIAAARDCRLETIAVRR